MVQFVAYRVWFSIILNIILCAFAYVIKYSLETLIYLFMYCNYEKMIYYSTFLIGSFPILMVEIYTHKENSSIHSNLKSLNDCFFGVFFSFFIHM